jgi:DNA polymerase-3 subunit beta
MEGLALLQNITNKRGTMAILSNILFVADGNTLVLTGTDLEVGLRIAIPAEIDNTGSITLPSKKIFEIVRESGSSELLINETDNSWVTIKAGKSIYNLAGIPSDEFPSFPEFGEDEFISFEGHIFLDLIDKVIFSIAGEQENIYSLTSVLLEKEKRESESYLRMVSSDGHRLSIMEKQVSVDVDVIGLIDMTLIPKKGIQELRKFCENRDAVDISVTTKQLVVKDDKAVMVVRLKQGEFPRYQSIVQAVPLENHIRINRILFLESLKRINLFTEDIFHTIQLQISGNTMVLSSQNADLGNARDEIIIEYSGEPLTLGFNCRYFIETLQVMECEFVDTYINSENSPCLMKSERDKGFISIIMPMQL